jgi:polysaccharide transporter, PST family
MSSRRKLLENFFSLAILQGFNFLLPLVTLPFLVRVLGPSNYGVIAFALSFAQFFIIITDYGFNLTATKEVSLSRDNPDKLKLIYNSVLITKVILMLVTFIIYFLLVTFVPRFSKDVDIFLLTFGMVIGNVFFSVWFFQGMEKMKFISILNIISKTIFTLGIFIFVDGPEDRYIVPLFQSGGFLVIGLLSMLIIRFKFKVKFRLVSFSDLKYQLKEGLEVFLSTLAISLYTVSNTFILGLFTNNTIVGYYAGAEKIVNAATSLISPISQTIYPHLNRLVQESRSKGLQFIKKVLYAVGGITGVLSIVLLIFAEQIVALVLGSKYEESVLVLRILSFLPLMIGLSNVFGVQTMLTFGYKRAFSFILILSSIVNILVAFILVPIYLHNGTAAGVMLTETIVTLLMAIYLKKKNIQIWR